MVNKGQVFFFHDYLNVICILFLYVLDWYSFKLNPGWNWHPGKVTFSPLIIHGSHSVQKILLHRTNSVVILIWKTIF